MSTFPVEQATEVPPAASRDGGAGRAGGVQLQLAGMLNSLGRLADLQVAIWLSGVRKLMVQVVLVSVMGVLAVLAVVVGVLFLYAGVFHILTDFLRVPTAWALLIFAGAHLGLAGVFVVAAIAILNRGDAAEKKPGGAA